MSKRNVKKHIEEGAQLLKKHEHYDITLAEFYEIAGIIRTQGNNIKYRNLSDVAMDCFAMGVAVGARISKHEQRKGARA